MRAAVVPHAPLLVDIPGRPHPLPECREALRALDVGRNVIVVSPHAASAGVYAASRGDLAGFGIDASVDIETDEEVAGRIATRWGRPVADRPLDHGAVVPLKLLQPARAVVCGLPGWTGQTDGDPSEALDAARGLGEVLAELDGWTVVISAHTSAAVTARAPLTDRSGGRALHDSVIDALYEDPARLEQLDPETARRCGACGLAPFLVLAHLANDRLEIHYEDAPFGVGYVVATT